MTVAQLAGGRYRADRRLGQGGMATVFLGRDEKLDRQVAIKLLAENLAADDGFRKRFMREARHAARLSHPNVVQVFDVGEEEDRPFMVMEYVDGANLEEILKRRRLLPANQVIPLIAQASAGLAHAHEAGLVHRDIKPHNLLRRKDGRLKIVDFGIARALEDSRMTDTGSVLGTRPYMAPEQLQGGKVSQVTDVYSLGVVTHELLTGELPEGAGDGGPPQTVPQRRAMAAITSLRGRHKPVPPELAKLVDACLQLDPKQRPKAGQLEAGLETLRGDASTTRVHHSIPAQKTRRLAPPDRPDRPGLGEQITDVTERVFNRVRPPRGRTRRRILTTGAWVALVGAAVLVAAILLLAGGDSNEPEAPQPAPAQRVEPAPQLEDPSDQARALADWLRARGR
jgi:serine/threonine protein kinase